MSETKVGHLGQSAAPTTPHVAVASGEALATLEAQVAEMEEAARIWGVRPHHPEGKFVAAQKGVVIDLGRLVKAAVSDISTVIAEARAAGEGEVKRLKERNEAAALLLRRMDAVQAGQEIERERLIARFVDEVAPMVAKELGETLVLRERGHHRRKAWKQVSAVLAAIAVLSGGAFALGSLRHSASAEAVDRCLSARVQAGQGGRVYCPVDTLLPSQ